MDASHRTPGFIAGETARAQTGTYELHSVTGRAGAAPATQRFLSCDRHGNMIRFLVIAGTLDHQFERFFQMAYEARGIE